ncbi:hypothetical protein E4U21_006255 [Claviceps maximensis]|nr:hypothetical protein E4U21_006255 [Claviceps maximensis]
MVRAPATRAHAAPTISDPKSWRLAPDAANDGMACSDQIHMHQWTARATTHGPDAIPADQSA